MSFFLHHLGHGQITEMLADLNQLFQIKNVAEAEVLFEQGRLLDEDVVIASVVTASVRKGKRDSLKAIELPRHTPPQRKRIGVKPRLTAPPAAAKPAAAVVPSPVIPIDLYRRQRRERRKGIIFTDCRKFIFLP